MTLRISTTLLLLAAGCAATGGAGSHARQEGQGLPVTVALPAELRAAYEAARLREAGGDAATPEDGERARAEWVAAASGYAAVAESPSGSRWRVPLLLRAAELRLKAQRWDDATEAAAQVVADAGASESEKAVASRLAATAALASASAAVQAGQLEKLDLREPPRSERIPPAPWSRVVSAIDAHLPRAAADPGEAGRPAGVSPAELALVAAEVQYAHGALEDARRRLETLTESWPSEGEVFERAVPLLLSTFRARGDRAGHDQAVERLQALVRRAASTTTVEEERAAYARALQEIERAREAWRFSEAERLLAEGRAEEAAEAFEEAAAAAGSGPPANALHNAAVSWDRAGKPERAAVVRERIVAEHASSPVAADDALSLAVHRSREGEHEAAARIYERFAQTWPESPSRCLALQNAASERDLAGQRTEAASRYLHFGSDERCARADPDLAARALVRAGRLFEAQAREAYAGAAALPGVSSPEAKGLVSEAKRRLGGP